MILVVVTPARGPHFLETPFGMTLKMLFFAGVVHNAGEMRGRHKITIASNYRQTDLECTKPVISKRPNQDMVPRASLRGASRIF